MANILVTAGPTYEYLDDVRYLANGSSGRMGYAVAAAALGGGHQVALVAGPTALVPPASADFYPVISALQMRDAVARVMQRTRPAIDLVVMVAAVADYRPARREAGKPKKSTEGLSLQLVPNPDILAELGAAQRAGQSKAVLVGFALESGSAEEILAKGRRKLERKGVDLIVVNHVEAMGAADNQVSLVFRDGRVQQIGRMAKSAVAAAILAAALDLLETSRRCDGSGTDGKRGETE